MESLRGMLLPGDRWLADKDPRPTKPEGVHPGRGKVIGAKDPVLGQGIDVRCLPCFFPQTKACSGPSGRGSNKVAVILVGLNETRSVGRL